MHVVVTGAGGFVGRPLCAALMDDGHTVTAIVRDTSKPAPKSSQLIATGDLATFAGWADTLAGADCIIHLAARTHTSDSSANSADLYEAANVKVTESLAQAANKAGVQRIVFISSIKVNGERTKAGKPFRPGDPPQPEDDYGRSKARAEARLVELAGGCEYVILRPPLMYGPGVRGNVEKLFSWAYKGMPLPIRSITNRRDVLGVRNFVSLILKAASEPQAANRIFLARDGEPVSTPQLYSAICRAFGTKPLLVPCPVAALDGAARLIGKTAAIEKLIGNLEIDDSETRTVLSWRPHVSMDDELAATARAFLSQTSQ